jgi:UDP-glucose 4-epimerase
MRVVVLGATGNVGTSVLAALADEPGVDSVLGVARRLPGTQYPKTEWAQADVSSSELAPLFRGADVVIHLAWLIQPGRDPALLRATNVEGSARVFDAVAAAGVKGLVYASSVGAYSRGPKDRRVDETWPTAGIESSFYARHKAEVERLLDRFEREEPETRVVRLRPGLTFKREAASGIRRLFAGPFLPSPIVRRELIPVVPRTERLCFQAVHSDDVGDAYRLAALDDVSGPFNIAAEPVLDPAELGRLLAARPIGVHAGLLRAGAALSYRARLQPTEPGWLDMGLAVPLMDSGRARRELGWEPRRSATDALEDLLTGLRERSGIDTPPLASDSGGPLRMRELWTRVGQKQGL